MQSEIWAGTPRKRKIARAPVEEMCNRDGHWAREFSSRLEAWPIVEPWVSDRDFHMIAAKGRRRLYLKEQGPFFRTLVDIKQYESQVTVSAWIEVKFWARALSLFLIPSEMFIDPGGVLGVRARRAACRDLNDLLDRFRQAPILGSEGFHFLDMDATTLVLLAVLVLPFIGFLAASFAKFEVVPGLSNALLLSIGKHLGMLAGGAFAVLFAHHSFAVKRFRENIAVRAGSAAIAMISFSLLTIALLTRTTAEINEQRFVHHCVLHFKEGSCRSAIDTLPANTREAIASKLPSLYKHLTIKP